MKRLGYSAHLLRFELLELRLALHGDHGHETLGAEEYWAEHFGPPVVEGPDLSSTSNFVAATALLPESQGGQWSNVETWPIQAIHAHLLTTGKVLVWAKIDDPYLWDPVSNTFTRPSLAEFNAFCSGHSLMADGNLLVTGGHISTNVGLPNASIYNPQSNVWTALADMNAGRWYPTATTLPSGEVLVLSGAINEAQTNDLPQVLKTDLTWRNLDTAQLKLGLYPRAFVAPSGQVFVAGPDATTRYLDTSGTGQWTVVDAMNFGLRQRGTAVMYGEGKILALGGANFVAQESTATAEVIDLTEAIPGWRSVSSMSFARKNVNATLLPNGEVLVTGGTSGSGENNRDTPVLDIEIWNPDTETFTTVNAEAKPRWYHSVALLLPDGRVLSAGGEGNRTAEVYSPPYLFQGPRPTITEAPAAIGYGQQFFVKTPDAANVTGVTLVRMGSVTHSFNFDQRIDELSFSHAAEGLIVTSSASANLAPPGYYMLFVLNGDVPSVATIVQLGHGVQQASGLVSTQKDGSITNSDGSVLAFDDSDILKLKFLGADAYLYETYFDASDVGLATINEDIDAFDVLPDGSIVVSTLGQFSVRANYATPGVGSGATIVGFGEDLLKFTPTTLGDVTAGSWSMFFDGSLRGLSGKPANIDAVSVQPNGDIIVSTTGGFAASGITAQDEDLVQFGATNGVTLIFDGSDVGLAATAEDTDALFIQQNGLAQPTLFLSLQGNFAVPGASGAGEDIVQFNPTALGANTTGSFTSALALDGSLYGLAAFGVDGFRVGAVVSPVSATSQSFQRSAPSSVARPTDALHARSTSPETELLLPKALAFTAISTAPASSASPAGRLSNVQSFSPINTQNQRSQAVDAILSHSFVDDRPDSATNSFAKIPRKSKAFAATLAEADSAERLALISLLELGPVRIKAR